MKLDYTIQSPEDRKKLVEEIINESPPEKLTQNYLETLADYLILCLEKREKQQKNILTSNHLITVKKREISYEGLTDKLESGEDGIFNMIANDKNIIFSPTTSITEEDINEVPGMKELRAEIAKIEEQLENARGSRAYSLKKTLIEMRKDQYVLKNTFRKPIYFMKTFKSLNDLKINETIYINNNDEVESDGFINLYDYKTVSLLLCNYSKLKQESYTNFNSDIKWIIQDLETYADLGLKDKYPLYYDLLIYKIDGKTNQEIQTLLNEKYGIKNSVEYISALWRNKIPKIIAETAQKEWLTWYYSTQIYGKWKKCSRCGSIKPAHKYFFSKNNTSKDGFYSICKECRNRKGVTKKWQQMQQQQQD